MHIYKAESELSDIILAQNTSAHLLEFKKVDVSEQAVAKMCSELPEATEDLFFFRAIMASTNVNLNDDGFDAREMFQARNTPIGKFINIEHEADGCNLPFGQGGIVGTISNSFMLDSEYQEFNPVPEEAPAFFHLGTTNIIWRHLSNMELKARAAVLIDDLESNKLAVSMESMFDGFDYAMAIHHEDYQKEDGTIDLDKLEYITRNEETAFLTKHLRAYGGEGNFEGKRIFRMLRNIVFSGLGIVGNPANPPSIVLDTEQKVEKIPKNLQKILDEPAISVNAGVNTNEDNFSMEQKMSEVQDKEVQTLKDELKTLRDQLEVSKADAAKANVEALQSEIEDLKAQLEAEVAKTQEVEAAKACVCNQFEEKVSEIEALQKEKEELKTELDSLQVAQITAQRVSLFKDKGYDDEKAAEIVAKLQSLDDETFKVVYEGYAEVEVDTNTAEVTLEEEVQPEEVTASIKPNVESENTLEATFARLRKGVASQIKANRLQKEDK